jgi:hypothetical protein
MKNLSVLLLVFLSSFALGQKTDTLTFFSEAFNQERTVYIQTPLFYKYQSDSMKLPVFYILDGQHDWFVNPTLSSIRYLQYTHEIPQAILVIIPLKNRNKECGLMSLDQPAAPLHAFITRELNEKLAPYHPGNYRVMMGHSFSASFSMYSYMLSPEFYSAIIANSPLDQLENLVKAFQQNDKIDKSRMYLSFGSVDKDKYHRKGYDDLKVRYPAFFSQAHTFLANSSSHTAMPITAVPELLSELFNAFSRRYKTVATVDEMYKLVAQPKSVAEELAQIASLSKLGDQFYPPELSDINGIASRYDRSGYYPYGISVYELGLKYYPNFHGFHYELGHIYAATDKQKAKTHLDKAIYLLKTIPEKGGGEMIAEIEEFKVKNGL